jgi:ribonuclease P protein component
MPKQSRLTREEIDTFFAGRPRRVSGLYFDLAFSPRPEGVKSACIVSKKTAPLAVDRNRVRRRVRNILIVRLPSLRPSTLVFTARPGAVEAEHAAIVTDIESLVGKARVSYNSQI